MGLRGCCDTTADWAAVADDILTKQMGINLKKYNRLIYIVPSGSSPCNFGGMGHVGCTSDCKAWLNGAIALVSHADTCL